MMQIRENKRYTTIAIILHWVIAIVIVGMMASGIVIHEEIINDKNTQFALYQWHKSLGVCALILVSLRIIWRLTHKPPSLPSALNRKQQNLAKLGHIALYVVLAIIPLSGWLIVSSSPTGIPTLVFNLIPWPHLPVVAGEALNQFAISTHDIAGKVLLLLLIGHIGVVIIHERQNIPILNRMSLNRFGILAIVATSILIAFSTQSVWTNDAPASKPLHTSNSAQGTIEFSGTHSDNPFNGQFTEWTLQTDFNAQTGLLTQFDLSVSTASAVTGSSYNDSTLRETDWFDVETHPVARYQARNIQQLGAKHYAVEGELTIKETTLPLNFEMYHSDGFLLAQLALSRLAYKLGVNADPDAAWVGDTITISARAKTPQ